MDRIYKVTMQGYVLQKDYMEHPDDWDWSNTHDLFIDTPTITIVELQDIVKEKEHGSFSAINNPRVCEEIRYGLPKLP